MQWVASSLYPCWLDLNFSDCGNFSHHDYGALTKYQADRFMSLLAYLHHTEGKPNWSAFEIPLPWN